ncbi:hypothetical protein B0H03_107106 [Rathayibacter iranicus NCPPB 2253 = VKM Ac-1602]|uniref:AraC-like protein n=1 Tax=Rathayibacter iranicus NCPPB 2253 = VKM Ac-1602 TaxID=1328868 RepID=A0ABX5LDJ2_9MICO|nr:hypothetical protein B0H03_107106 [Rathayibacter iranicus NCPPB 2253 = VKM Ac-1602]
MGNVSVGRFSTGAAGLPGWEDVPRAPGVTIESVSAPMYRLDRVWSPSGTLRIGASAVWMSALLVMEGSGALQHGDERIAYVAGDLFILDGRAPLELQVDIPTAHFLWRFAYAPLLRASSVRAHMGTPVALEESYWSPLSALANSLLAADPAVAESIYAARASKGLLVAALSAATRTGSDRPIRASDLFADAVVLIAERKYDPDFTAAVLALELDVPERLLEAVFAALGGTAGGELDRQRTEVLQERIRVADDADSFEALAKASGFSSEEDGQQAVDDAEE